MAKANIQSFLVLERALTRRLLSKWAPVEDRLVRDVTAVVEGRSDKTLDEVLNSVDFDSVIEGQHKFIRMMSVGAFMFGVARLSDPSDSEFRKKNKPVPALNDSLKLFKRIMRENAVDPLKQRLRQRALQLIAEVEDEQDAQSVQKADAIRSNREIITDMVNSGAKASFETVSSLHNSRLAGWGFVAEADALGIETYAVSEQIDSDSICPVCVEMHGKTFSVERAATALEQMVTAESLNDVKQMAKFPPQNKAGLAELRKLTTDEIESRNWHVPPYHPLCRGLLVDTGDEESLGPIQPSPSGVSSDTQLFPDSVDDLIGVDDDFDQPFKQLRDSQGKLFNVNKVSNKSVVSQSVAYRAYESLGVRVPKHRVYTRGSTKIMVSEAVDGVSVDDALKSGLLTEADLKKRLVRLHAADSVLGASDTRSGLLVSPSGELVKVNPINTLGYKNGSFKKALSQHPTEFWDLMQSDSLIGDDDFYDMISQTGRWTSKNVDDLIDVVPDDFKDLLRARIDSLKDVADVVAPMKADGIVANYASDFGRGIVGVREFGIIDDLPSLLRSPEGGFQQVLVDESGQAFDGLRQDDFMTKVKKMVDSLGGDYSEVSSTLGSQASSSSSTPSQALSFFIHKNRGSKVSDHYWPNASLEIGDAKAQFARQAFGGRVERLADLGFVDPDDVYRKTWASYQAIVHETLRNVKLPNVNQAARTMTVLRTEDFGVLQFANMELKEGVSGVYPRQVVSSTSLVAPFTPSIQATLEMEVPFHRVYMSYLFGRAPGIERALASDFENEFVVDLFNIPAKIVRLP